MATTGWTGLPPSPTSAYGTWPPGVGTTVKSLVVLAMAAAPDSMRKPAESIPLVARPVGGFAAVVPHLGTGFGSTSKATRASATNEFRFWPAVRDVGEHTAVV
jgi:hypothetical protein